MTSRNWPRVMSPTPGRSTLITSAPMTAEQLRAGRARLHMGEIENTARRRAPCRPGHRACSRASAARCAFFFAAAFFAAFFAGAASTSASRLSWRLFRLRPLAFHFIFWLRLVSGLASFSPAMNFRSILCAIRGARSPHRRRSIYFFFSALCGLRLPMRPLSLPAAGSITALMRVGLPVSIAASTARFSSSGVVAFTPTPPKASIILS